MFSKKVPLPGARGVHPLTSGILDNLQEAQLRSEYYRYWQCLLRRRTQGMRSVREDLRGGPLREQKDAVQRWCDLEMSRGHEIGGEDLLDQMQLECEDLIYKLENQMKAAQAVLEDQSATEAVPLEDQSEAAPQDQPATEAVPVEGQSEAARGNQLVRVTPADVQREREQLVECARQDILQDEVKLKAATEFLSKGMMSKQSKLYHKMQLLMHCQVVERKPDLVFPMSEAESRLLMQLGWQSFDRLVFLLAYGSAEVLKDFVAQPEEFIEHRESLPIVASDAVPVYLDIATGKILVPLRMLDAAAKRRLAKKRGLEPDALHEDLHITAEGASRGEKDRLTWICTQCLHHYFKKPVVPAPGEAEEPAQAVVGEMMPSILLVPCATFCRLENICPETNTWLESEEFVWNGKPVVRKAGDPVPKNLMGAWKKAREDNPELFQEGENGRPAILIWGSLNAYQNEVVCAAFSKLLSKFFPHGCVHQVDMFSGELTEMMEKVNYVRHQPKTVIPPKQTAKCQVTDIYFARVGKAAGQQAKQKLRRAQRAKARDQGVAARLEAGAYESIVIIKAMHDACVAGAKEGKVEQSFRKAGWLAYELGPTGLREATGPRWAGLPLGGSNLSEKYMELRYSCFNSEGEPERPDWSRVHKLRKDKRDDALDDKRIKAMGLKKAHASEREGKKGVMEKNKKEEDAKAEEILTMEMETFWNEKDHVLGVLSEYLPQEQPDEDYLEKDGNERLELSVEVFEGMEKRSEASWMQLPPKRRREILEEGNLEKITSQAVQASKEDERELRQVMEAS